MQTHFWKEHYVHSKFSGVRSSHDFCARTPAHSLEGTLLVIVLPYGLTTLQGFNVVPKTALKSPTHTTGQLAMEKYTNRCFAQMITVTIILTTEVLQTTNVYTYPD